jgi:hypothetical protein
VTLIPQQALTSTSQRTPTPVVHLTDTIRALFDASPKSDGREVEVIGYFRGWDLLGEVKGGSPVTRSDWVIADQSGAIYVTGLMPQGLNPSSRADIWTVVRLRAVVVYAPSGSVYLKGLRVDIIAPGLPPATMAGGQTKTPGKWQIAFNFTGGITGLRRVVELSDAGPLTVIDEKTNRRATMQVSATELAEIATLVANAKSVTPSGRLPNCRDCFEFGLEIKIDGQQIVFKANDLSLTESGLELLIKTLVRLQDKALSGQKP